ncbi:MAG: diaminopimelate epimerase [Bergeyella sp.]|nr:diaminopimelate epimerase [Bergeyella sp.]
MNFYKYQGTGNDFVIIDNRDLSFTKNTRVIKNLCDRRFGVGADGLILLENDPSYDFTMIYYNSDGREGTMCGNGGRCIVAFAHFLGIFSEKTTFCAIDGVHKAEIKNSTVKLKMIEVPEIQTLNGDYILNTGSPHYVKYVENLENFDVYTEGKKIRNSSPFKTHGINVNFVEKIGKESLFVRTYERGVEAETFSCGTGVTAAALTYVKMTKKSDVKIKTLGGILKVYAQTEKGSFYRVWLEGPAIQVFKGNI